MLRKCEPLWSRRCCGRRRCYHASRKGGKESAACGCSHRTGWWMYISPFPLLVKFHSAAWMMRFPAMLSQFPRKVLSSDTAPVLPLPTNSVSSLSSHLPLPQEQVKEATLCWENITSISASWPLTHSPVCSRSPSCPLS